MAIAFFDLDGTLLSANTASLWIRREVRLGHVRKRQAARAALWLAAYKLGVADLERGLLEAISTLAGTPTAPLQERTEVFYREVVQQLFRPGGLEALAQHRARGDRLVLLTSTSSYMGELVARDLSLDAILCNRFEVGADGHHTGRPAGPLCFGRGKLEHALAYARQVDEALEESVFYTDSYSDLAVMQAVGRPVAVNPDQRLRRYASNHGWEIVDWDHVPFTHGSRVATVPVHRR